MAELQGDLEIIPFADLLQQLVTSERIGTMTLTLGKDKKVIHVGKEGLRLLSTTTRRTNSLGEIMLRTGKVSRTQLDKILQEQKKSGVRLGEIVKKQGLISQEDLNKALCEQAEEEIYDLFLWDNAKFAFKGGNPPRELMNSPMAAAVVDSNPASIMLEAARRADELKMIQKVIPGDSMVPVKTMKKGDMSQLGMDQDVVQSVYDVVNGRRTVEDVVSSSLYPKFDAMRALYVLTKSVFVKILDQRGVTVVRKKKDTSKIIKPPPVQTTKASGIRRTIILMGDLVTYRSALAQLLRQAEYEVIEEAGSNAMNLLRGGRKIDGVILDVALDNPAGYEFCSWLSDNIGAPIIVLSSDPSDDAVQKAVGAGASNYVVKPFTRDVLLKAIGDVVSESSVTN